MDRAAPIKKPPSLPAIFQLEDGPSVAKVIQVLDVGGQENMYLLRVFFTGVSTTKSSK